MPDSARPRLGLQAIAGADNLNTIDTTNDAQMDIIDALAARVEQGTFGSRPTSTPGTPGITGRFYYATDQAILYFDHGTGWVGMLPPDGGITNAKLADESVGGDELTDSLVTALGLNDSEGVRRGKSIIATQESRANVAYGLLTTPDRVQNVVLPTDGLIVAGYQATWAESVTGAARAAIFIGSNQLKGASGASPVPIVQEAQHGNTATQDQPLFTCPGGLHGSDATAGWSDVTTGQVIGAVQSGATFAWPGGLCHIFAAAGTYDVSVQFKASSGSVTVKNRKLWVATLGF